MRVMSIDENNKRNITPHPLRDFEIFERHSRISFGAPGPARFALRFAGSIYVGAY
jgi:hypothetical protein